jgi:hypothetical protein
MTDVDDNRDKRGTFKDYVNKVNNDNSLYNKLNL